MKDVALNSIVAAIGDFKCLISWEKDMQHANIDLAFEDYEDTVADLLSSNYKTFDTNLARFLAMLNDVDPFTSIVRKLPDVAFENWYENAIGTVKSMVGSGDLNWPKNSDEYLAMRVALLRHIASGKEDVPNFCSKFMYAGRHFDDMIAEFADQIIEPVARDIQKRAQRSVPPGGDLRHIPAPAPDHPPWYQRPLGMVVIGVIITIIGGLALAFILG